VPAAKYLFAVKCCVPYGAAYYSKIDIVGTPSHFESHLLVGLPQVAQSSQLPLTFAVF